VAVVIRRGGLTIMERLAVAVCTGLLESVTITVKVKVPWVEGFPEITPVVAFRVRPGGRAPELMENVRGAVPPEVIMVAV